MFNAIRNFFIRRKKEQLRHKNTNRHQAVVLEASPAPSENKIKSNENNIPLQSLQAIPYWFELNKSFENISIQYPPENLQAPQIDKKMRELIKEYVKDISPEPDGSMALYTKLNDPNASVKEITALVTSDPILAAHILKLVNSAAFGLTQEITAIGRAVTLLGFQNVKAAVLQHSIRQGISGITGDFAAIIREHSIMSSAIALHLGENIGGVDHFTLSSIGLLHDIGKVLYPSLIAAGKGIKLSIEVPEQVIEALIASIFAELWELPQFISSSLEYIHHPYFYPLLSVPNDLRKTSTIIAMSNQLASVMGFPDSEDCYEIGAEYLAEINHINEPNSWIDENLAVRIESTRAALK